VEGVITDYKSRRDEKNQESREGPPSCLLSSIDRRERFEILEKEGNRCIKPPGLGPMTSTRE